MDDIQSLQHTIQQLRSEIVHLKSEEHLAAILSTDQRYQESQVRFRTVFEASRLGNKIIAPDLKILQVNQAMVTLLGFETKEDLIGAVILDFAPDEYHSDWHFLQKRLWQKLSPSFSFETCLQKKDGSKVWCQITSILFPDNGQTLGYTIIEDITERYNLRKQREEFISIASHELKTPITSLQATIQIINKIVEEGTDITESLKKFAANAQRYVKKVNHLIEDLLNVTKIEQGQLALNKNIFALSELIDGCCDHINAGGRHHLIYTGDHFLKVTADQNKIEQVVVNFVNNAAKYAPESYEIVIDVKRSGNSTKVSVIDKGKGIPPGGVAKLFERYYRDEENKEQVAGLGLGLYVSSEIIKRHGGDIGVESEPGIGSAFWFTLPDVKSVK